KLFAITTQSFLILNRKSERLITSAFGGHVMQRPAKHVATQPVPVATCVSEMQMPRLIDRVGRRDLMSRHHREEHESLVLLHDSPRESKRPTVLVCEPPGERQRIAGTIQLKGTNLPPQTHMECVHRYLLHQHQVRDWNASR